MLDCRKDRLDYGEQLIPPDGYRLARAIAATYSLDLDTLLSIPVALFYAQTMEGIGSDERVQLLEAIHRCPQVLRIYHQAGRIAVPSRQNRLYGLLEDCLVGVLPQNEHSSFHPKIWLLRYERETEQDSDAEPARYRLIVLSRNLTYDRSWDIAATLDGDVSVQPQEKNRPLVDFVRFLLARQTFDDAERFVDGLARVEFASPPGFTGRFGFHPIGIGGYRNPIETQKGKQLLCLSPFVHGAALARLCRNVPGGRWLFGRGDELARIDRETLKGFQVFALSERIVEGEALSTAEDGGAEPLRQDLHAKLFVYKRGERANTWFVGSANATKAAFERNVEFLLELNGTSESAQLETLLDDLLGKQRDTGIFEPFEPPEKPVSDDSEAELDQRVRRLEFSLLSTLQITRCDLVRSPNGTNYDLLLGFVTDGLKWQGLDVLVAPFNTDHHPQPLPKTGTAEFRFENINEGHLSRFLRFEIRHAAERRHAFLMKVEVAGMPESRIGTIVRSVISDSGRFFEYLRFLLADEFELPTGSGKEMNLGAGVEAGETPALQTPLYEQLLVTASRRPKRLQEIDDLITQLTASEASNGSGEAAAAEIVPQQFLEFWQAFRSAVALAEEAQP